MEVLELRNAAYSDCSAVLSGALTTCTTKLRTLVITGVHNIWLGGIGQAMGLECLAINSCRARADDDGEALQSLAKLQQLR